MNSIIVVLPKPEDGKSIRNLLSRHGYDVTAVCTQGAQVLNYIDMMNDGIIVSGYKFSDMYYFDLKNSLPEGQTLPEPDEKRFADLGRQLAAARNLIDDGSSRLAAEPVQRQPRHVRMPRASQLVVGPAGDQRGVQTEHVALFCNWLSASESRRRCYRRDKKQPGGWVCDFTAEICNASTRYSPKICADAPVVPTMASKPPSPWPRYSVPAVPVPVRALAAS